MTTLESLLNQEASVLIQVISEVMQVASDLIKDGSLPIKLERR
jgi:hypothetical protein